jgi:hypothetical protein
VDLASHSQFGPQRTVLWFGLVFCAGLVTSPCRAQNLEEIVSRGSSTLKSDWGADESYAYVERDEAQKNGMPGSKTSQVVYIAGSDYYLPLAIDDLPLAPDREKLELQKLKNEIQRRNEETPEARQKRIGNYKKQRTENEALVLDFPNAFDFELLREETMDGHAAWVLSGTPKKKRPGATGLAAKVLSGMQGTVWVDKQGSHAIRVECDVLSPVPVFGILARVLPGTRIEFAMAPVTDSIWLISELSMKLRLSKFFRKSMQDTRSTYSDYRLNSVVVEELLAKANQ